MPKDKTLAPVRPNAGVEADYRRRLIRLIDEMSRSVIYWTKAAYRANEPAILAADADPADALRKVMDELSKRWQSRFDDLAETLAEHFAKDVSERSDTSLKAALRKAGFTVKFKITAVQRDILKATVQQNVALIRSIPSQYFTQVQGSVMRAVQSGFDLGALTRELQDHHGVTKRRAAFIARDQSNKASAALVRNRHMELGIEQARWVHSAGGKTPRKSHVQAGKDGVIYDIAKGWFDPDVGEAILPGQLPNCRCVGRPIIKGLSS